MTIKTTAIALSLAANAAIAQVPANLPPVIDLADPDKIALDVTKQSKTVQCASKALASLNIPGAALSTSVNEKSPYDHFVLSKSRLALIKVGGTDGVTLNYQQPNQIKVNGYNLHNIGAEVSLSTDQKYVNFKAFHEGSYNKEADAANAGIVARITPNELQDRKGGSYILGERTKDGPLILDPKTKLHGAWVIAGVQGMEKAFADCMGITSPQRPASAAQVTWDPPITKGVPITSVPALNK